MDIKEKAKHYKAMNGDKDATMKDMLWYLVGKCDELDDRLIAVETVHKMLLWFVPICVGLVAIGVNYFLK